MKLYRPNDVEIAAQAAEWLHSIRDGEAREREGFAEWLLESRRHVRAALMTIAVEKELEQLDPQHRIDVQALLAQEKSHPNVVALDAGLAAATNESAAQAASRSIGRSSTSTLRRRVSWGLAAAIAGAAVVGWQLPRWSSSVGASGGGPVFTTATGQQQSVKLDDGSVVHLNTESRIHVAFSGQERAVRLVAGEALFDVQRDAARPFQVHVGETLVRALGTQFNVDRHTSGVTVTVIDGRVEVSNGPGSRRILGGGEEVRIGPRGAIESLAAVNLKRRVAWRERRLEFQDDPLSTVVAEFNRYNRAPRLRLATDDVGARLYSGIFSADDPESLAQVLGEESDLSIARSEDEIVIGKR